MLSLSSLSLSLPACGGDGWCVRVCLPMSYSRWPHIHTHHTHTYTHTHWSGLPACPASSCISMTTCLPTHSFIHLQLDFLGNKRPREHCPRRTLSERTRVCATQFWVLYTLQDTTKNAVSPGGGGRGQVPLRVSGVVVGFAGGGREIDAGSIAALGVPPVQAFLG